MNETRIGWRGPFDWDHLSAFLRARTIAGVESFEGGVYARGTVRVTRDGARRALVVAGALAEVDVDRVRRLFDVDTDCRAAAARLEQDPLLAPVLRRHRGIRVPGGWDPFEIVVRAIAGQQVSVAAARSVLGSIVEQCGERTEHGLSFPTPARLAVATLRGGMPRRRLEAIQRVAGLVAGGEFLLERRASLEETLAALQSLPGVGPWTANYIAMRALGEKDAFPAGDLVLRRAAGNVTEKRLLEMAEAWRPWRAYAAIALWAS